MSRSAPRATNPAKRFLQWSGGADAESRLNFYDKEAQEKVDVPFDKKKPFIFLVLDELHTVTGFSDSDQSSVWSNEVRDLKKEPVFVRTGKGLKLKGLYGDVKGDLTSLGGKYAKSVYIATKNAEGALEMAHIKLSGAALTAWIDFNKKWDVYKVAVKLEGAEEKKKGATTYFTPVFGGLPVSEATNEEAKALDTELQNYLRTYFANGQNEDVEVVQDDDVAEDIVEDVPPAAVKKEREDPAPAATKADDEDELSEVPF